jgi:hypothetical protein
MPCRAEERNDSPPHIVATGRKEDKQMDDGYRLQFSLIQALYGSLC